MGDERIAADYKGWSRDEPARLAAAYYNRIDVLRREVNTLRAQFRTACGYGSDAGMPPWMK